MLFILHAIHTETDPFVKVYYNAQPESSSVIFVFWLCNGTIYENNMENARIPGVASELEEVFLTYI